MQSVLFSLKKPTYFLTGPNLVYSMKLSCGYGTFILVYIYNCLKSPLFLHQVQHLSQDSFLLLKSCYLRSSIHLLWCFNVFTSSLPVCVDDSSILLLCVLGCSFVFPIFWTLSNVKSGTCNHNHKKRKDSLETRAVLLIFLLELEISGVAVQRIHQNSQKWWPLWGIAYWK